MTGFPTNVSLSPVLRAVTNQASVAGFHPCRGGGAGQHDTPRGHRHVCVAAPRRLAGRRPIEGMLVGARPATLFSKCELVTDEALAPESLVTLLTDGRHTASQTKPGPEQVSPNHPPAAVWQPARHCRRGTVSGEQRCVRLHDRGHYGYRRYVVGAGAPKGSPFYNHYRSLIDIYMIS
jgi:hypothetical protein